MLKIKEGPAFIVVAYGGGDRALVGLWAYVTGRNMLDSKAVAGAVLNDPLISWLYKAEHLLGWKIHGPTPIRLEPHGKPAT